MEEASLKGKNLLLFITLIIIAFVMGSLITKVQCLEKNVGGAQQTAQPTR